MDYNFEKVITQAGMNCEPYKLVDYSDSESDEFVEETCVGKRGRKNAKSVKNAEKRRRGTAVKQVKLNPCLGKKCQNNCSDKFSELDRAHINAYYWGLASDVRQKDYLFSCIDRSSICRKRASTNIRKASYKYFISFRGDRTKVCQQFLIKTLGISQMTLRHSVLKKLETTGRNNLPKRQAFNKTKEPSLGLVRKFIEKLPAVPSHYCRNKSTKLYLPAEFRNVPTLYKHYVEDMRSEMQHSSIVSLYVFRKTFNTEYHLGFHLPKKDKCDFCEKIKNMDLKKRTIFEQSEKYRQHISDKNKAKELFLIDQAKSKVDNSTTLCVSFDLQKVLHTPYGSSVNLFYTRKYSFYNESIYESGTKLGYCFLWGECDGNRGCNEICSIMFKYLTMVDNRKQYTTIILYCDSCAGQNRNRAMIAMIFQFLKSAVYIQDVKITYLLPGHTMMPVDSIHATIESFIKKRTIWAPSEWPTIISNSRTKPKQYEIIVLNYTDFMNWKSFSQALIPPKIKIKFNSLRTVHVDKRDPKIKFKYGYFENCEVDDVNIELMARSTKDKSIVERGPVQLYAKNLEISVPKYADLKSLCERGIIPDRYCSEYIKMKRNNNIPDTLAESDEEDETINQVEL